MSTERNQFSEREKEVIKLLLKGKGNKQIALALGISNRTVEFHLSNIYSKLGVNSRSEALLKLTGDYLWESTGGLQVKSTVANVGDSTENGFKPISRIIPMKKLFYILAGLLTTILILVMVIINLPAQASTARPTLPFEKAPTKIPTVTPAPATNTQSSPEALPAPVSTNPSAGNVIPPHTVDGYTATIESYYVDTSHVIFQVRLAGGGITFGNPIFYDRIGSPNIYDENGSPINANAGWGPGLDPALYEFNFVPVSLLKGDHIKGQFSFDLNKAPEYEKILAHFRFDFDLPINPDVRFYPKQVVTANKLDILLDSVTITPTFTQIYLCFTAPTFADWNIASQSVLQIGDQKATPYNFNLLFDSAIGGDRRAGSEPYWIPPIKNGRCIKSGFPIGSSNPATLTLTIPTLEKSAPEILLSNHLAMDYPGLSAKQAYHKFLEEHENIYRGPWIFTVSLVP